MDIPWTLFGRNQSNWAARRIVNDWQVFIYFKICTGCSRYEFFDKKIRFLIEDKKSKMNNTLYNYFKNFSEIGYIDVLFLYYSILDGDHWILEISKLVTSSSNLILSFFNRCLRILECGITPVVYFDPIKDKTVCLQTSISQKSSPTALIFFFN